MIDGSPETRKMAHTELITGGRAPIFFIFRLLRDSFQRVYNMRRQDLTGVVERLVRHGNLHLSA